MWSNFSSRRRQPARTRQAFRTPQLVQLEDRLTPSAFAMRDGFSGKDAGTGIGTDIAGNVYLAGYETDKTGTQKDAYVAKYDANGVQMWTRHYGAEFDDAAT